MEFLGELIPVIIAIALVIIKNTGDKSKGRKKSASQKNKSAAPKKKNKQPTIQPATASASKKRKKTMEEFLQTYARETTSAQRDYDEGEGGRGASFTSSAQDAEGYGIREGDSWEGKSKDRPFKSHTLDSGDLEGSNAIAEKELQVIHHESDSYRIGGGDIQMDFLEGLKGEKGKEEILKGILFSEILAPPKSLR